MFIYIYIYTLTITGQSVGQNWLTFFREPIGIPGVT